MAQTIPPPPGAPTRVRGPARERPTPALVSAGARQRRWSLALVAVLLTLGSGLAFVALWINAGDRKPVLAVAKNIPAGQVIQDSDLAVVRVSTDSALDPVPSSQRDELVGKVATVDLLAGTLLVESAVGSNEGLESGKAEITIPVPIEEISPKVEPGSTVRVLDTGPGNVTEGGEPQPIAEGRVSAVESRDNTVSVSLIVNERDAVAISGLVRADRLYLATVTGG